MIRVEKCILVSAGIDFTSDRVSRSSWEFSSPSLHFGGGQNLP